MKIVELIQGTPEWHEHRRNHKNASDAPAVMGASKYTTRDELLHQKATGITKEVDAETQKRFDEGHRIESLARTIAEQIIAEPFYPVTGTNGEYSASFDGLNMSESIAFEHKTLNKELLEFFTQYENEQCTIESLGAEYRIQMEHQLMVSVAEKCLFMASKWDGDTLVEEHHCWYYPDYQLRQRIIDAWKLFDADLANYKPKETKEVVIADVVESLPAPSIVAKGTLVASNLNEVTPMFDKYLAETKRSGFTTALDFANAKERGKEARKIAKTLNDTCESVIAQSSDINQAINLMRKYAKEFNTLALELEKTVEAEEKAIKNRAVMEAKQKYADHISKLQSEIMGINISVKLPCPDFDKAIKGLRNNDSMHARINEALNAGILDAEAIARDVRVKLAYLDEATKGYEGLFVDKQTFIFGEMDYIKLLVKSRIDDQKAKDAQREAEIKARAEAEALAKLQQDKPQTLATETISTIKRDHEAKQKLPKQMESAFSEIFKPTAHEIVQILARAKGVHESVAHQWLIESDFRTLQAA